MYNVSEATKNACRKDSEYKLLKIKFKDNEFDTITNTNIISESMELSEKLMSSDQFHFGECNASRFTVTVAEIDDEVMGKEIEVVLVVNDEDIPLGKFTITNVEEVSYKTYKKITAISIIDKLNTDVTDWYDSLNFPISLGAMRISLLNHLGLDQEVVSLPMDAVTVGKHLQGMAITGKWIIQGICELNGMFGRMNRDGHFEYVDIRESSALDTTSLLKKAVIEKEYIVENADGVLVFDDYGTIYNATPDAVNPYVIDDNFVFYGMGKTEIETTVNLSMENLLGVVYRPLTSAILKGQPYVEIGDKLDLGNNDTYYIFEREIKGVQSLTDTISSKGTATYKYDKNSMASKLSSLNRTTGRLKIDMSATEDGVKFAVSKSEEASTKATEAKSAADSVKDIADSANAKADEAKQTADGVKDIADEALSKADEAKSTADGIKDSVIGENIIPYPYRASSGSSRGITFTSNDDGSVSYVGTGNNTNTPYWTIWSKNDGIILSKGTYTVSCKNDTKDSSIGIYFYNQDGTKYTGQYEGLISSSSEVYIFSTTNKRGAVTDNEEWGVPVTFTIFEDALVQIQVRVKSTTSYPKAVDGTGYPMMEKGEIAHDYQPYSLSREGLQKANEDTNTTLTEQINQSMNTVIQQTSQSVLASVEESYYSKDQTDEILGKVSTEVEVTKDAVEFRFNELKQSTDASFDELNNQLSEQTKYVRIEDGNIILGEAGNELTLVLKDDRISFVTGKDELGNDIEVAYFTNQKLFVTDGEFTNSLQLGNFGFIPRASGNLSFMKVK